jgi:glutathione S-transferase
LQPQGHEGTFRRPAQSEELEMAEAAADEVLLVGRYLSPFVRRVAVTLRHFGVPYRRHVLSTLTDMDEIARYSPIGRVPVMVLPTGETLIDSAAMLDHLDEGAGAERALMPAAGPERQRAMFVLMLAVGAIERAMTANGEQRRPADRQSSGRLDRLRHFTRRGFLALERELSGRGWLVDGRMRQPDITAAVGLTFVHRVHPGLIAEDDVPALSRLAARCEATPLFQETWIDIET